MEKGKERKANRLIKEKSPYLLKHAFNPVDWYPWGEEAIKKAKNDSKPILLSIGYSSCHWCNVMEKESFEDEEIASIINKYFIPVKVDREERPEIDKIYMTAVQAMTGSGGWPLTVFLTPDLKPFFAGTYFPPEPRGGLPGFKQVLEYVARLWSDKKDQILQSTEQIMENLKKIYVPENKKLPSKDIFDEAFASIASSYDEEYGGFGFAPKFAMPCMIDFLFYYNYRKKKELAVSMAKNTLTWICRGGINDHIGGGFHRYSTDRVWLVPHFEKMLYDNALIGTQLLNAYKVTNEEIFAFFAKKTIDWLTREMMDNNCCFYSAQDADTSGGEGIYYTWTPEEVEEVLGPDGKFFCRLYNITDEGNFENRSIPNLIYTFRDFKEVILDEEKKNRVEKFKEMLYKERIKRERPLTDTKVLTSWNGLAISFLVTAYQTLKDESYIRTSETTSNFILDNLFKDGLRRYYKEGETLLDATLEDYSFLVNGLLDLFETNQKTRYLEAAIDITNEMIKRLYDENSGCFKFDNQNISNIKIFEAYDGVTPSGNSVAATNLLRLAEITGRKDYRDKAESIISYFGEKIEDDPSSYCWMLKAYDFYINGLKEIVIVSEKKEEGLGFVERINSLYSIDKVLLFVYKDDIQQKQKLSPLLASKDSGGKVKAYLCKNFVCLAPTDSLETLVSYILS